MKHFIKLVERTHKERFKVVIDKIIDEKIPVAFLSTAPFDKAIEQLKENQVQFNITKFITPPPKIQKIFSLILR